MEAIILAGAFRGESSPRSADPFTRVGEQTFIDRLLAWLARTGVTRAIVASEGPLASLNEHYPNLRAHGIELVPCPAEPGAGTGGALRRAASWALRSDTFVVVRADRFLPVDPNVLERRRARAGVDVALALVDAPTQSERSRVQLDDAWRVSDFGAGDSSWIEAGLSVFTRHGLLAFAERESFDLVKEGLAEMEGDIAGLVFPGPIADLQQPTTVLEFPWDLCDQPEHPGSLPT